jgi:hypothetical protein
MCQESVCGSPSDAVKPIQLKNFRIYGVAATNAKAGDKLAVLVRAEITSDQPEFHGGAAPAAYTMERALQAILTLDQLNFYGVGVNHTVAKGSADAPNASGRSEDTAAKRPTS